MSDPANAEHAASQWKADVSPMNGEPRRTVGT